MHVYVQGTYSVIYAFALTKFFFKKTGMGWLMPQHM